MDQLSLNQVYDMLSQCHSRLVTRNTTEFVNFSPGLEENAAVTYYTDKYEGYRHFYTKPYQKLGPDPETGVVADRQHYRHVMRNAKSFIHKFKNPTRVSLLVPGIHGWDEIKCILAPDRRAWRKLENRYYDFLTLENSHFQEVRFGVPSLYFTAPEE